MGDISPSGVWRMFGYFECPPPDQNKPDQTKKDRKKTKNKNPCSRWKSASVYCRERRDEDGPRARGITGRYVPISGQQCQKCKTWVVPYRLEWLFCDICWSTKECRCCRRCGHRARACVCPEAMVRPTQQCLLMSDGTVDEDLFYSIVNPHTLSNPVSQSKIRGHNRGAVGLNDRDGRGRGAHRRSSNVSGGQGDKTKMSWDISMDEWETNVEAKEEMWKQKKKKKNSKVDLPWNEEWEDGGEEASQRREVHCLSEQGRSVTVKKVVDADIWPYRKVKMINEYPAKWKEVSDPNNRGKNAKKKKKKGDHREKDAFKKNDSKSENISSECHVKRHKKKNKDGDSSEKYAFKNNDLDQENISSETNCMKTRNNNTDCDRSEKYAFNMDDFYQHVPAKIDDKKRKKKNRYRDLLGYDVFEESDPNQENISLETDNKKHAPVGDGGNGKTEKSQEDRYSELNVVKTVTKPMKWRQLVKEFQS